MRNQHKHWGQKLFNQTKAAFQVNIHKSLIINIGMVRFELETLSIQ